MSQHSEPMAWAQAMFGECELGDRRRTQRLVKVGAALASHVGDSLYAACRGDEAANEGAYRFMRNEAVEPKAIAEGAFAASVRALGECGLVLSVEDTTTLSYAHAPSEELGDLGGPEGSRRRGFHVHSALLVDAHGERTLGLAAQHCWRRDEGERGQRARRRERAYETKESFKWQRTAQQLRTRLGPLMERVVSVCDREADVFEYLYDKVEHGERFVVRAAWDRRTAQAQRLFERLENAPVLGAREVEVMQRGGRRARRAQVELRGCALELCEPRAGKAGRRLQVNAVLVHESEPPEGTAGLRWVLLSSEPIDEGLSAQRLVRFYELRWRIEEFHQAWKSGATCVEDQRLQSPQRLERMAVILAFVAVRVMQLREVLHEPRGGTGPKRCCTEVLSDEQWKVLWLTREKKRPPKRPPSLRWAYESVAKLGGWIDTKRTGRAGWKALWEGWFILEHRVEAVQLAQLIHSR